MWLVEHNVIDLENASFFEEVSSMIPQITLHVLLSSLFGSTRRFSAQLIAQYNEYEYFGHVWNLHSPVCCDSSHVWSVELAFTCVDILYHTCEICIRLFRYCHLSHVWNLHSPVQILSRVQPVLTSRSTTGSRRSTEAAADKSSTLGFKDYLSNRDFVGAMALLTVLYFVPYFIIRKII